jgi:hypothetical protein
MSIANELSTDIAAALLTDKTDDSRLARRELAEVVMEVHSTLRRLTAEARRENRGRGASPDAPPAARAVGSGDQ